MASLPTTHNGPDNGIPGLVRSLTMDSKRLASDELRLAKLELNESVHTAVRGGVWMALALAIAIIAVVALTVLLIAAVARMMGRNYWAGALIIGVIELMVGWLLVRRGVVAVKEPSLTLEESRASLEDMAAWVRHPRNPTHH